MSINTESIDVKEKTREIPGLEGIFKTYGKHHICPPGWFVPSWKCEHIFLDEIDLKALAKGDLVGIQMNKDVVIWLRKQT